MASKKKAVRQEKPESQGLSKEEDEIARYLRFNCKSEQSFFQENEVHYFTGCKAVDTLYESKYGTKAKGEAKFPNRAAAANYIQGLMDLQLFFRARKLVAKKKSDKNKEKAQGSKKRDDDTVTETEGEEKEKETTTNKPTVEKKKKKVKLELHDIQVFNDDKDVYVWVFDPTPLHKKIIGLLMVVGTIVACLFPLWPMWLRQGVYYLSMGGIGLFGIIIVTAILRTILYFAIWLVTMGQHKLWVLPNLTEDCGFFESFKPFYTYEYCPKGMVDDAKKSKKKDKVEINEEESKPLLQEDAEEETKTKNSSQSENSASEVSAPPTPAEGVVKKRKVRRADDFVHVRSQ